MGEIRGACSLWFRVLLANPLRVGLRDFKSSTIFAFYGTFKALLKKIGRSAASMVALRAETNTEISAAGT